MFKWLTMWVWDGYRSFRDHCAEYRTRAKIDRAARRMCIVDRGPARLSNDGCRVRIHSKCATPARVGDMYAPLQRIYWCYRCEEFWHSQDDDDGGPGGKKLFLPQPPRPDHSRGERTWKESEEVLRKVMQRDTVH
jgi:hypothetical protein